MNETNKLIRNRFLFSFSYYRFSIVLLMLYCCCCCCYCYCYWRHGIEWMYACWVYYIFGFCGFSVIGFFFSVLSDKTKVSRSQQNLVYYNHIQLLGSFWKAFSVVFECHRQCSRKLRTVKKTDSCFVIHILSATRIIIILSSLFCLQI